MSDCLTRRALLSTVGIGAASLAGCTGDDTGDDGQGGETEAGATGDAASEASTDLDLREANVVGVKFERDGSAYRFSVTLYHDDDGEDGYANWWQVETLDGERLGRRKLLHAHSTDPFTRSETIEIPADVSCVVVRGHDQTHGYGGAAMLVNLGSSTKAVTQGSERQSFDAADCP